VDCTEVMEQLFEYLDPDVRVELRKQVDEHLHSCHDCSYYVDTVRKTVTLYQADLRIELPMKASERLRAALAAEYAAGAPRKQPVPGG
jgi:predicted anti-sigma-YlaC factor YlaD